MAANRRRLRLVAEAQGEIRVPWTNSSAILLKIPMAFLPDPPRQLLTQHCPTWTRRLKVLQSKTLRVMISFLAKLAFSANAFASLLPANADLLKKVLQDIRNIRLEATLKTLLQHNASKGIDVKSISIPLYDGAPDNLKVTIVDAPAIVETNDGLTKKDFKRRWLENADTGHLENTDKLKEVLQYIGMDCS
ncbi:hypothetical protein TSTA_118520 [Talaromyces stipitatus ATCC 10500]|uniref:Uncharacterized protein n=1 Tax=Talaromyces stipitatus (strain ATCC 10500 / CBS 375.48 / QM 6759 / NRRL 1006) TaxID=441959 RepID=B8M9T3_TALSN|nr:uncharacterized protein TSTA_118520 [Talaromyces stipitatus ATCC 10500]EED18085.1 hypothetical protein TSTA_118520 [Talaromyces stipitatus ATCC 10500]